MVGDRPRSGVGHGQIGDELALVGTQHVGVDTGTRLRLLPQRRVEKLLVGLIVDHHDDVPIAFLACGAPSAAAEQRDAARLVDRLDAVEQNRQLRYDGTARNDVGDGSGSHCTKLELAEEVSSPFKAFPGVTPSRRRTLRNNGVSTRLPLETKTEWSSISICGIRCSEKRPWDNLPVLGCDDVPLARYYDTIYAATTGRDLNTIDIRRRDLRAHVSECGSCYRMEIDAGASLMHPRQHQYSAPEQRA